MSEMRLEAGHLRIGVRELKHGLITVHLLALCHEASHADWRGLAGSACRVAEAGAAGMWGSWVTEWWAVLGGAMVGRPSVWSSRKSRLPTLRTPGIPISRQTGCENNTFIKDGLSVRI